MAESQHKKSEGITVIKRDGRTELFQSKKTVRRLVNVSENLSLEFVDQYKIVQDIERILPPVIRSTEIDHLIAKQSGILSELHPDYNLLGGRVEVSKLHKETEDSFSKMIIQLFNAVDCSTGEPRQIINDIYYNYIISNATELNEFVDYRKDYSFTYVSYKILEQYYLLRVDNKVVERPQHLFMRVAVALHKDDLDSIKETYRLLSEKYYIHGSPTLFYALFNKQQMCSSFTITLYDHFEEIFKKLNHCATIAKLTGDVGIDIQNMRVITMPIPGITGISKGLVSLIRLINRTFNNLGECPKRPGRFAIYIEPWHAEVYDFLQMSRTKGDEIETASELFYVMWVPDLLMKRLEWGAKWSLMDPFESPGLSECWGEEFEERYINYEGQNKRVAEVPSLDLWWQIVETQVLTGMPYILYKDTCNRKSNVQHLGTIRSAGFSTDILPYTSTTDVGSCCYASINLGKFVNKNILNLDELKKIAKTVTRNLNKIIDVNFYPVPSARKTAHYHRPIAIGVQGFADVITKLQVDMDSSLGQLLNQQIFETIYFGALEESCALAKKYGPYKSYNDSPISKGILQFDMWEITPSDLWNWAKLKNEIAKYGVRNSLLIALMPTETTSQILGSSENIDPLFSNLYKIYIKNDGFTLINTDLVEELTRLNLWNEDMRQQIVNGHGSIQKIEKIPLKIREAYKNAWEIPVNSQINYARDRGPFVDQSQAINLYVEDIRISFLQDIHYKTWKRGLKTGMYRLSKKPLHTPVKFVCDKNMCNVQPKVPIDLSNLVSSTT